ncbi:MFS transporter [Clostridium estertheticum]|uniref:MFS transporter n=1 Tax=Clostridium estertheticum TaxID=238834 RepID=UPI001CF37F34|nr:MFS transporter [Clostridium estertheticum]MCB2309432.1 MFS transporter [Clostridium estertheticum]MCB2346806.1 MFS transporter [Clostridium estertheticum]MCB2346882.1 MFS transporter [Clostridium estertheticum]MCB2351882.1 MFS transporter [Clostridium estertheticum]WAG48410.1 MFS transporter [Clostridium estertheticum]
MITKISAYKTYLLFSGAMSLLFWLVFTVTMVYHIEVIHLNPLQLILVGTTMETACFLFEIPTSIVADIYSRKLSVIIGLVLIGLGFTLEGSIPKFAAVLASQILWGIGHTFISGAIDAWIAGENKTRDLGQIYLEGAQASQIGSVIGIILSTIIGNFSIRLPIILSGCLFVVFALFLAVYMPEYNFRTSAPEELNTFGKMMHTFKSSLSFIKSKPIIIMLLAVTLFYGLSSEGYDRLTTVHFLKDTVLPKLGNLQAVTWFGIFNIAGMILSATTMQLIIKKLEKNNKIQRYAMLVTTNIFTVLCMLLFALTRNFGLMLAAYLSINIFRNINEPIYNAWLNSHLEDNARATVLSVNGQLNSLGQILGGPIIGIIATKVSISIGIACTSLLLTPVIGIYILSILKGRKETKNNGKSSRGGDDIYENN